MKKMNEHLVYARHVELYNGVPKPIPIDPRILVTVPDSCIQRLANTYQDTSVPYIEWCELRLHKMLRSGHLKYVSERHDAAFTDFWQFPYETIALDAGDCEDIAILLLSLIYHGKNIDRDHLCICIGEVTWRGARAHHAWVQLTIEGRPFILDPLLPFVPVGSIGERKKPAAEYKMYGHIRMQFNKDNIWVKE